MENFILNHEKLNDNSAINEKPLLIDILQGKLGRGMSISTKINENFYSNCTKRTNKNGVLAIRCKNFRLRDGGCSWTGKLLNLTGALPGSPEYLDVDNWLVIHNDVICRTIFKFYKDFHN